MIQFNTSKMTFQVSFFHPSNLAKILLLFACLWPLSLSAQVQDGYKALKKKDYTKAESAFEKTLQAQSTDTVAAHALLSMLLLERSKNDGSSLLKSVAHAELALNGWKDLNKKTLDKWNEKFTLTQESVKNTKQRATDAALNGISKSNDLLLLDSLNQVLKTLAPNLKEKKERIQQSVVKWNYEKSKSYPALRSVALVHRSEIAPTFGQSIDFEQRLLSSFIAEFGMGKVDEFVKSHPEHWLARDCWTTACANAFSDTLSMAPSLRFFSEYPYSYWSYNLPSGLAFIEKKRPQLWKTMSAEEKRQLDDLNAYFEAYDDCKNLGSADSIVSQVLPSIELALENTKNSVLGWAIYRQALENLIRGKHFQTAIAQLQKHRHLFPDGQPQNCAVEYVEYKTKQAQVDALIEILRRPDEQLHRKPIVELNTADGDEMKPVQSFDNARLYFTAIRRSKENSTEDVFEATLNKYTQVYEKPKLQPQLSSSNGNEAVLSTAMDGSTLLLFRNGKINICSKTANGWSDPVPVKFPGDFAYVGQATLSADGGHLVFEAAEKKPDLFGRFDLNLYVCTRNPATGLGAPVKLGELINTVYNERTPFLAADGKTLFFSSSGLFGLGGHDIYSTTRLDDTWENWSAPKNLGKEINTTADDWSYSLSPYSNGRQAIFSMRNPETNKDDLYEITLPVAAQAASRYPLKLDTQFVIKNIKTGEPLKRPELRQGREVLYLLEDGEFELINPWYPTERIRIVDGKKMEPTPAPPVLPDAYFEVGKAILKPEASTALDVFLKSLQKRQPQLQIIGHSDNLGSEAINDALSKARAGAVRDYLVSQKYPLDKIAVEGRSFREPIAPNDTVEGRAKNRRVEIKLLD